MFFISGSLEQLDFRGEIANVSETYAMSISVSCVLEIARAIDILVHSFGNKRPSKSFIDSRKDPGPDSRDRTGIGSEAMRDREEVEKSTREGILWFFHLGIQYRVLFFALSSCEPV